MQKYFGLQILKTSFECVILLYIYIFMTKIFDLFLSCVYIYNYLAIHYYFIFFTKKLYMSMYFEVLYMIFSFNKECTLIGILFKIFYQIFFYRHLIQTRIDIIQKSHCICLISPFTINTSLANFVVLTLFVINGEKVSR